MVKIVSKRWLTLAELSRKLDLPRSKMDALLRAGILKPEEKIADRISVFSASRLEEIRAAVNLALAKGGEQ